MTQLAVIQTRDLLSGADIEVLKNSKFKNFTDQEIKYAMQVCSHLELNPLLNQIHFVKRESKSGPATVTVQVGIDGFRLGAARTGEYAGSDEPVFAYSGVDKTKPAKATMTIYRVVNGVKCAFTASVLWAEYYPQDQNSQFMWNKMPHSQLAKCAESQALRKGFPAELSALRTDEEMAQASDPAPQTKAAKLNSRGRSEPAIQDADFSEVEPLAIEEEPQEPVPGEQTSVPMCCNREMKISKYPDRVTGEIPYWCTECKRKEFTTAKA